MKHVFNRILTFALIVCIALSTLACAAPAPAPAESIAPAPTATIAPSVAPETTPVVTPEAAGTTVIDQAGREVAVPVKVERIVSGYYITSSACIALGLSDKMVGIEANAAKRPIYAIAAPKLLDLPNVGSAKEFDLEGCIALKPDLVLLPLRLKDSAQIMEGLGIAVLLVNPESHEGLVEMINMIAFATGTDAKAAELISYYSEQLAFAQELTADVVREKVYMAGNSSYLSTAPKDMYQASLIRAAGGENAADGIEGDNWVDVSYEQLLAMSPDVIIIPTDASYSKDELMKDKQLAKVPAVKGGKVYHMPVGIEAWDSPIPSGIMGVQWLLSVLHDGVYPFDAMQNEAVDFYGTFYNATIDSKLITK